MKSKLDERRSSGDPNLVRAREDPITEFVVETPIHTETHRNPVLRFDRVAIWLSESHGGRLFLTDFRLDQPSGLWIIRIHSWETSGCLNDWLVFELARRGRNLNDVVLLIGVLQHSA